MKKTKLFNEMTFQEKIDHIRECQREGIKAIQNGSPSYLADIADHLEIWGPWLCDRVEELQKKIEIALKALKKAHGALGYAYDDHADMFYLNSQDDINQCIKEIVDQ